MPYGFHKDKDRYFEQQRINARDYVIPFIEEAYGPVDGKRVMEIGCGEGGVLQAFLDRGCEGSGIELAEPRAERAEFYLNEAIEAGKACILKEDIHSYELFERIEEGFDVIVLKDVIEHIHGHEKLFRRLKEFLKPKGCIFFGFPPWQMPFGGHQQLCKNKLLSRLPYFHLLPRPIYKGILQLSNERQRKLDNLMDIKSTGLSLERFERVTERTGYKILNRKLYLFNPIYRYKFGVKPREQLPLIKHIPYFRDLFTTCGYYLITPRGTE